MTAPAEAPCCNDGVRIGLDPESAQWVDALCGPPGLRDDAVRRLHALLLRGARFQVNRSRAMLVARGREDAETLAQQAADDATMAVLARLASFEGRSRFTTWAYKFAILHASVAVRQAAWQRREIPVDAAGWPLLPDPGAGPEERAVADDIAATLREAITSRLTAHQRMVLVTLAVNDVPIDVLAARLGTTRGALYKALHDARARLRDALAEAGLGSSRTGPPREAA